MINLVVVAMLVLGMGTNMRNPIDSFLKIFSPATALKRSQSRLALDVIERKYDVASKSRRNTFGLARNTSAAQEVSKASALGAAAAQDLCRNNPLALRAKRLWGSNVVGTGVTCEAFGNSADKLKVFNERWNDWANSVECDFEGHNNLYGLQKLWVETTVESGAVFIREHINNKSDFPLQLQTIEQEYLDKSKNKNTENGVIIDGIEYNSSGQIKGYWLLTEKTLTGLGKPPKSKFHKASRIIHMFRKDRAGQHLGMTWFGATATTFKNYNTYQDAKLMQQQIAACLALIVEEAESTVGRQSLSNSEGLPDKIEPAMVEYVPEGTKVHTVTPPKADNSNSFDTGLKRDMAVGIGLTYEQLSGDYSLVNFASGRMGKNDFHSELDTVQMHMFKPALDRVFNWFNRLYQINEGKGNYKPDWTFPVRTTVNPEEEFRVLMSKVRHGMLSPRKAAKSLGMTLEKIVEEWKLDKKLFGDMPFDIDPSVFASTGNQLDDNDAASANNSGAKDKNKTVEK